jgi:uncharacterized protein (TIGR00255 family)
MIRSMTAFGRAFVEVPLGRFIIEIQSLNKKFLEVQVQMPRELARYELDIKKWVSARVLRGTVSVKVFVEFLGEAPYTVRPNMPLIKQLKSAWHQIAVEFGGTEPSISLLANHEDIMIYSDVNADENGYKEALQNVMTLALDKFVATREREGKALYDDMSQRLESLTQTISRIEKLSEGTVPTYKKKLEERIKEFADGCLDNEDRILREICLYADRVDISEEITRFRSHVEHFKHVLNGSDQTVGKTLEFIIQEMGREANTMGSKSVDADITRLVVEIKGELERIREQVQNVE